MLIVMPFTLTLTFPTGRGCVTHKFLYLTTTPDSPLSLWGLG